MNILNIYKIINIKVYAMENKQEYAMENKQEKNLEINKNKPKNSNPLNIWAFIVPDFIKKYCLFKEQKENQQLQINNQLQLNDQQLNDQQLNDQQLNQFQQKIIDPNNQQIYQQQELQQEQLNQNFQAIDQNNQPQQQINNFQLVQDQLDLNQQQLQIYNLNEKECPKQKLIIINQNEQQQIINPAENISRVKIAISFFLFIILSGVLYLAIWLILTIFTGGGNKILNKTLNIAFAIYAGYILLLIILILSDIVSLHDSKLVITFLQKKEDEEKRKQEESEANDGNKSINLIKSEIKLYGNLTPKDMSKIVDKLFSGNNENQLNTSVEEITFEKILNVSENENYLLNQSQSLDQEKTINTFQKNYSPNQNLNLNYENNNFPQQQIQYQENYNNLNVMQTQEYFNLNNNQQAIENKKQLIVNNNKIIKEDPQEILKKHKIQKCNEKIIEIQKKMQITQEEYNEAHKNDNYFDKEDSFKFFQENRLKKIQMINDHIKACEIFNTNHFVIDGEFGEEQVY